MYYDDHNPPHFHASYEGLDAMFDFKGNLIKGYLSPRAQSLIKEWCSIHEDDLIENWHLAQNNQPLKWIEPLR